MKVDIFDYNEFLKINKDAVVEVTDNVYFDRNSIPTPMGLFSYELFGTTPKDRKEIWGYMDLKDKYLHPIIYKVLKRVIPKYLDGIINGLLLVSIDKEGNIYEDPENGNSGLDWLYQNFENIHIPDTKSNDRKRRLQLLDSLKKNEIFLDKFLIIPPFYRDMKVKGGITSVDEVNSLYSDTIRRVKFLQIEKGSGFSFTSDRTRFVIQENLVKLYNYYTKEPNLAKKNGIIRRSLMGKSVDNGARLVISVPRYNINDFDKDTGVKFDTVGVPLPTVCATFYPFMQKWVLDWFERNIFTDKFLVVNINGEKRKIHPLNPRAKFNAEYVEKMVKAFIKSPASRFDKIVIPTEEGIDYEFKIAGSYANSGKAEDKSNISVRPMTVCDLLYRAAVDVTRDKHVLITRYPLTDYTGVFTAKIHVMSTITTKVAYIDNQVFRHYPDIDVDLSLDRVSVSFIDTLIMSNLYLAAMGADYDGDQVTVRGVWTQEANIECAKHILTKKNILNVSGSAIRTTTRETIQTMYSLTLGLKKL